MISIWLWSLAAGPPPWFEKESHEPDNKPARQAAAAASSRTSPLPSSSSSGRTATVLRKGRGHKRSKDLYIIFLHGFYGGGGGNLE